MAWEGGGELKWCLNDIWESTFEKMGVDFRYMGVDFYKGVDSYKLGVDFR